MGNESLLEKLKNIDFIKKDRRTFLKVVLVIGATLFFQTYISGTAAAYDPDKPTGLQSSWFKNDPYLESVYDGHKVLSEGMQRTSVLTIQKALMVMGYSIPDGPTNYFGKQTKSAVKDFQRLHGLKVDGIVDRITMKELDHTMS